MGSIQHSGLERTVGHGRAATRGRWLLGVMAVLLCMGCPETWGREGTMDKAMEQDIRQRLGSRQCPLSPDEWESLCKNANSRAEQDCPVGCEP